MTPSKRKPASAAPPPGEIVRGRGRQLLLDSKHVRLLVRYPLPEEGQPGPTGADGAEFLLEWAAVATSALGTDPLCQRESSTSSRLDRPAWTDRFSGEQLAGNAQVVRGVPLDVLAVGVDELLHDAEHGPALIKQLLVSGSGGGSVSAMDSPAALTVPRFSKRATHALPSRRDGKRTAPAPRSNKSAAIVWVIARRLVVISCRSRCSTSCSTSSST